MSLDGQKLTAVQKGEVDSTITREWSDDTMIMVSSFSIEISYI